MKTFKTFLLFPLARTSLLGASPLKTKGLASLQALDLLARPARWGLVAGVSNAPIRAEDLCHPIANRMPFTRDGGIFERKHDGFRALARSGRSGVQLVSQSGRSIIDPFPELAAALEKLPPATLDGMHLNWSVFGPEDSNGQAAVVKLTSASDHDRRNSKRGSNSSTRSRDMSRVGWNHRTRGSRRSRKRRRRPMLRLYSSASSTLRRNWYRTKQGSRATARDLKRIEDWKQRSKAQ